MTFDLTTDGFPESIGTRHFKWAPILFHPVQFAQDRHTIGVVVVGGGEAYMLPANRLNKFECLFAGRSESAIFAASVALEAIAAQIKNSGIQAVDRFVSPVSGVVLGDFREAEAHTWEAVANRWLEATSPLFDKPSYRDLILRDEILMPQAASDKPLPTARERLPLLVLEYIQDRKPTYARYFTPRVSRPNTRRPSYEAVIDYSGHKIVANFGTLKASHANSVNLIKRRMWDLTVDMEKDDLTMLKRDHEMIVQAPAKNDPQISDTQYRNLMSALEVLEAEADTKEIRLRPMTTVQEIGEHLLRAEAA